MKTAQSITNLTSLRSEDTWQDLLNSVMVYNSPGAKTFGSLKLQG